METAAKLFAQNLKAIRAARGLTQDALSERLGVAVHTVQNYESGRREPDLQMLHRLAEELEVHPAALLTLSPAVPVLIEPTPLQAVEVLAQFVKERAMEKPIQRQADLEAATRENQRLTEKVEELEKILSQGHHLASRVARLCPEQQEEFSRRLRQMEAAKAISSSDQESKPPSSPAARKPR